jgi:hypothetical protein
MDCKNTSWTKRRGFTLTEVLMAVGSGSLVLAAIATMFLHSGRSFVGMYQYVDMDQQSRFALDKFSLDIRGMDRVASYSAVNSDGDDEEGGLTNIRRITLVPTNGAPSSDYITYRYRPNLRRLQRTQNDRTEILLEGCDFFRLSVYQRGMVPGTFIPVDTTNASLAKQIRVDWRCSRELFAGQHIYTESVQSAKFVLRIP